MLKRQFNLLVLMVVALLSLVHLADGKGMVFIDDAGRQVELPAAVSRVMAAGPPASVMIYALAPDKLVGWVRAPNAEEKAYLAAPYGDLPAHGRLTGKGNTANLEAVLAMKPDVIIDVGTVDASYASLADRVQAQTGIPYILIDGTFAKTPEALRKMGTVLSEQANGEALAGYAEKVLADVETVVKGVAADGRPRVYYGRGPDGPETGLKGSINTEIIDAVGASNVADAAGSGGLANVSVEQVLAWNPDVILTLDKKFQTSVLEDPVWAGISAVKGKRVFRAPSLPFGWFDSPPGINRLIGVPWLLSVLYPGQASGDIRQDTRDFYKMFYHVDLTDAQIDGLLLGAIAAP